jgi:RNA polymerase-interacting CarD/CdnL/TRCF family regulator
MTVGLMAVILRTRPGSRWSLPDGSQIGRGASVLSGGESNWSRRYKANLEKLASGDLVKIVEVVRDLAERDASRGLSAGEKRMLARARLILLREG